MRRVIIAIGMAMLAQGADAHDIKKCFAYQTKSALLRKYDFKYLAPSTHPSDFKNCSVPTDTTSKEGISKFSTESSTQGSTMSLDPAVSTNSITGETQFISSFGECSMLGMIERDDKRDAFVASNWEAIRQEIALGHGENLATVAYLGGIAPAAYDAYVEALRARYPTLNGPEQLVYALNDVRTL